MDDVKTTVLPVGDTITQDVTTGTVPPQWRVPNNATTEGFIEITKEVVDQHRDQQLQDQIEEAKGEIPKSLEAKAAEIPENGEIQYLVDNNLLPPEALDKFKTESGVEAPAVVAENIVESEEEEEEDFSISPEVPYDESEEWETSITEEVAESEEDILGDYEIVESTNEATVFRTYIHERPVLTKVEHKKLDSITDPKAFELFLTEQRKKYRDKVSMPLINSGIMVDFIGAGAFDYTDIYSQDPENSTSTTDTLNRMKVMMKNIIDVEPKMSPKKLLSSISYTDYQLASLGFAAATVPEIDTPGSCEKCNAGFIIRTKTVDTVLNADKIKERWTVIQNTPVKERVFKKTVTVDFFDGYMKFFIELPNFEKVKQGFSEIEQAIKSKAAPASLRQSASVIINIDHVIIDNVIVNDVINVFKVIKTLTDDELGVLRDAIKAVYDDVVAPEFGVSANCPKCGHHNTIPIGSVEDMVFFHFWVKRMLETVKSVKKNMTNG